MELSGLMRIRTVSKTKYNELIDERKK